MVAVHVARIGKIRGAADSADEEALAAGYGVQAGHAREYRRSSSSGLSKHNICPPTASWSSNDQVSNAVMVKIQGRQRLASGVIRLGQRDASADLIPQMVRAQVRQIRAAKHNRGAGGHGIGVKAVVIIIGIAYCAWGTGDDIWNPVAVDIG